VYIETQHEDKICIIIIIIIIIVVIIIIIQLKNCSHFIFQNRLYGYKTQFLPWRRTQPTEYSGNYLRHCITWKFVVYIGYMILLG